MSTRRVIARSTVSVALGLALGCRGSLSPLSNKIHVGQEAYVVFAADGEDGAGDLYAAVPVGGTLFQITFTRVDEEFPALSRDGTTLAFLRGRAPGDGHHRVLVVMNLLNGAERQVDVDEDGPASIGWSTDGQRIYVRLGEHTLESPAPPADLALAPVSADKQAAADSQLTVLLGDPPLAEAVACDSAGGICAQFPDGKRELIARTGVDPVRWTGDSIAYRDADEWVIRPLGGGMTRALHWAPDAQHPRNLTLFPGPPRSP